jgi:hypothetical protein
MSDTGARKTEFSTELSVIKNSDNSYEFSSAVIDWLTNMEANGSIDSVTLTANPAKCDAMECSCPGVADKNCCFSVLNIDSVISHHIVDDEHLFTFRMCACRVCIGVLYDPRYVDGNGCRVITKLCNRLDSCKIVKTLDDVHCVIKNKIDVLRNMSDCIIKSQIEAHNEVTKNLREWN